MTEKTYTQAFEEVLQKNGNEKSAQLTENLIRIVRYRGHQSLLPAIVREFGRMENGGAQSVEIKLTLARESDEMKFREAVKKDEGRFGIENITRRTVFDDTIIGGYRLESEDFLIDRTYKKALIDMYRKMIL